MIWLFVFVGVLVLTYIRGAVVLVRVRARAEVLQDELSGWHQLQILINIGGVHVYRAVLQDVRTAGLVQAREAGARLQLDRPMPCLRPLTVERQVRIMPDGTAWRPSVGSTLQAAAETRVKVTMTGLPLPKPSRVAGPHYNADLSTWFPGEPAWPGPDEPMPQEP